MHVDRVDGLALERYVVAQERFDVGLDGGWLLPRRVGCQPRLRLLVLRVLLILASGGSSFAQVHPGVEPGYHGILGVVPARGSIDRRTGAGIVNVRGFFSPNYYLSNGLYPDKEAVLITLGADAFALPVSSLHAGRGGTTFAYRGPRLPGGRTLRSLRLRHRPNDGFWSVAFTLSGVALSRLNVEDSICLPLAVVIGDDDGFSGVVLTSPSLRSRRLSIPRECDPVDYGRVGGEVRYPPSRRADDTAGHGRGLGADPARPN